MLSGKWRPSCLGLNVLTCHYMGVEEHGSWLQIANFLCIEIPLEIICQMFPPVIKELIKKWLKS